VAQENNINTNDELILVTGGAGLLGTALIEKLLQQNKKVRAIYHHTPLPTFSQPLLSVINCDILDVNGLAEAMQGVSHVYHCAGKVSFHKKDRAALYAINVEGTANIVNAALAATVKKIVHVSSVAALGRIRKKEMITEQMNWTPETSNSIYGHSKFLGEMEVWRAVAEGLPAVVINPVIILGPGKWNETSTRIFKNVYEGSPWFTDGVTGFVDVNDVANIMIQLMKADITKERFIVSAENASYKELIQQIAVAFNKPVPNKKFTPALASFICLIEKIKSVFTGRPPLITKETAATALAKVQFDNRKLLQALPGFNYKPLAQTIKDTCTILQQKINRQ